MTASPDPEFKCCPAARWAQTEDLGQAEGVEFTLGRCSACGRYWMYLWTMYSRGPRYSALDDGTARELMQMAPGPARKRRLVEWFNS
jgi:hypothetical protein